MQVLDKRGQDLMFVHSELDDYGLDPCEFRLYARIVRRAGNKNNCYETVANMAKGCLMSERKVRAAQKVLEAGGLISIVRVDGAASQLEVNERSAWKSPKLIQQIRAQIEKEKREKRKTRDSKKTPTPSTCDTPGAIATPGTYDIPTPSTCDTPPLAHVPDKGNPSKSIQNKKERADDCNFPLPVSTPPGNGESDPKNPAPQPLPPALTESPKLQPHAQGDRGGWNQSAVQRMEDRFKSVGNPLTPWRSPQGLLNDEFIGYVGRLMYSKLEAIAQRNKAISALKFADPRKNSQQHGEMLSYWKSFQMETQPASVQPKGFDPGPTAGDGFWETTAGASFKRRVIAKGLNVQVKAIRMGGRIVCLENGEDKIYQPKGAA